MISRKISRSLVSFFMVASLAFTGSARAQSDSVAQTTSPVTRVAVTISGGFETMPEDGGRPVVLIAAALGVPTETFRAAFRKVRPAPGGTEPAPAQVRQNKEALMSSLAPYGVTNERLDTVSNYYRYERRSGAFWTNRPAKATALFRDGKVFSFIIDDPGAGYSSSPTVKVPDYSDTAATVELVFGKDLRTNGGIARISVGLSGR